jgi:hypothetical protein
MLANAIPTWRAAQIKITLNFSSSPMGDVVLPDPALAFISKLPFSFLIKSKIFS